MTFQEAYQLYDYFCKMADYYLDRFIDNFKDDNAYHLTLQFLYLRCLFEKKLKTY